MIRKFTAEIGRRAALQQVGVRLVRHFVCKLLHFDQHLLRLVEQHGFGAGAQAVQLHHMGEHELDALVLRADGTR